jgi:beta-N-acetylhexosaminidase
MENYQRSFIKGLLLVLIWTTTGIANPDVVLDLSYNSWAEQTLDQMSFDEKIGQLLMVTVHKDSNGDNVEEIEQLLQNYHIGNLLFLKNDPQTQCLWANHFQTLSKHPLLIAQDCEWGLAKQLSGTIAFPYNMTLGALSQTLDNERLLYALGYELGRQCRRTGIHINFGPVLDINSNPSNLIMGCRSFGDEKVAIANNATMLMMGMQNAAIIACAKHFPGCGDTTIDALTGLPVNSHPLHNIINEDFHPFKSLINFGLYAILVSNVNAPALDRKSGAITLSKSSINEYIRKLLQFKGLIIADAFDTKSMNTYCSQVEENPNELVLKALQAGIDIVISPNNIPSFFSYVKTALQQGTITENDLDSHVLKVLQFKELLNLHNDRLVSTKNIIQDINPPTAKQLKFQLYQAALTLVTNDSNLIPLKKDPKTVGILTVANNPIEYDFPEFATHLTIEPNFKEPTIESIMQTFASVDTVIMLLASIDANISPIMPSTSIATPLTNLIKTFHEANKNLIVVLCTSPYALQFLPKEKTIMAIYEYTPETIEIGLKSVFGIFEATGKLPIKNPNTPTS